MRRKLWVLVVTMGLLMACSSGTDETPEVGESATEEVTTVDEVTVEQPTAVDQGQDPAAPQVVQFAVSDWELPQYQDLADLFEEDNPDVRIVFLTIEEILDLNRERGEYTWPEDASRRIASNADVFKSGVSPSYVEQGLILDMAPLIAADQTFSLEDFYPVLVEQFAWFGGQYALPLRADFDLIFYDKDKFDAAGLAYPEPGWSWPEMLEAAQALTLRDGDEVIQWGFVEPNLNPARLVRAMAGPLVDEQTDPPTLRFTDPEVTAAVQWYTDLFTLHEVAPFFPLPQVEDGGSFVPAGYALIDGQKAAMWMEWSGAFAWRSFEGEVNFGAVPYPISEMQPNSTPVFAESVAISAGTTKPDAAWRWVKFLTENPTENLGLSNGGPTSLPARISVAESSQYWERVNPDLGAAIRFAIEHAGQLNYSGVGFGPLYEAVEEIVEAGVSVESALAEAQAKTEEQLAEAELEAAALSGDESEPLVVIEDPVAEIPQDAVEIIFVITGDRFGVAPWRDLAEAFREIHPDIVVDVREPDYSSGTVSNETIAREADCFTWFAGFSPGTVDLILPLDPLIDADSEISRADYFPLAIELLTYEGQLTGLPGSMTFPVIEYDKELFDAAGVAYPSNAWTTDEFLATAVALSSPDITADEERIYGFVPETYELPTLYSFMHRLGGLSIDTAQDPPVMRINDPASLAAFQWYVDLSETYAVKPVYATSFDFTGDLGLYEERQALLRNGQVGMWHNPGYPSDISYQNPPPGRSIGVVAMPTGPNGETGDEFTSATGFFISAETQNRQACWEWIKFASARYFSNSSFPAHIGLADSAAYTAQVGQELVDAYLVSLQQNIERSASIAPTGDNSSWLGFSQIWVFQAFDKVLNGEMQTAEALGEAQEKFDQFRACLVASQAIDEVNLTARADCLREVDDSLPESFYFTGEE